MDKKAQAEIIGLVLIVIMVTLGMLFFIKFSLESSPEKKVFTRKGLAYSTMSSLLKTEIHCRDPNHNTFLEIGNKLIEDCAAYRVSDFSNYNCENLNSCDFLDQKINIMLEETLGEWNKNYRFTSVIVSETVSPDKRELLLIEHGDCENTERDSSGLFPLYVSNAGLVESTLLLCG